LTLVVFAGTGTDVGKTYVAASLIQALRERGNSVAGRKPVQSFAQGDTSTDADVLARAAGVDATDVCPPHRWFAIPLAPPMAAEVLGQEPFTIAELATEVQTTTPAVGTTIVETAGGVRSPIAADGDCVDLIRALAPDVVVLVADAGLGTINAVRMSEEALRPGSVVVYLNRYDPETDLHVRNADWLRAREGLDVVTDIEALVTRIETMR
jgi:dethiobiotin synthetase